MTDYGAFRKGASGDQRSDALPRSDQSSLAERVGFASPPAIETREHSLMAIAPQR